MHEIGEEIRTSTTEVVVSEINDVIPVKWNGMRECLVVCMPEDAAEFIVAIQGGKHIVIMSSCKGKDLLADII